MRNAPLLEAFSRSCSAAPRPGWSKHVQPGSRNTIAARDDGDLVEAAAEMTMEKPTQEQLAELKRLSKEARVPDESEIVTSRQEAETRIRDLKEKARIE
jgi:hypothetical protein